MADIVINCVINKAIASSPWTINHNSFVAMLMIVLLLLLIPSNDFFKKSSNGTVFSLQITSSQAHVSVVGLRILKA